MDDGIDVSGLDIPRDLKRVESQIEPGIVDVVRKNSRNLQQAASTRALSIQLRGGKKGRGQAGLRQALAAAVGVVYANEKVTFVVHRSRMPSGKEAMPLVSVTRSWRHPVYGNMNVWVTQTGQPMWFGRAIGEEAMKVLPPEIEKMLKELAR